MFITSDLHHYPTACTPLISFVVLLYYKSYNGCTFVESIIMTSTLSDSQENQMQFFDEYYSILVEHQLVKGKKVYIGSKNNRKCRFCGKNAEETTFRMVAHALPEFIGNKTLIANDECDICNERFSRTVEDHMAKFLQPYLTIGLIRGKKGVPSFKDKKKLVRIEAKSSELEIHQSPHDEVIQFKLDREQFNIELPMQPHTPVAVYKCLTKMAISIMPEEELNNFRDAIDWINAETHTSKSFEGLDSSLKFCLLRVTPGSMPYRGMHTFLLKRKLETTPVPYIIYVVAFGNLLLQIIIPSPQKDEILDGKQVGMGCYPVPFDPKYNSYEHTQPKVIDLSSSEVAQNGIFNLLMAFETIEFCSDESSHE